MPSRSQTPRKGKSSRSVTPHKAEAKPTKGDSATVYLPAGVKGEFRTVVPPASITMRTIHEKIPKEFFERSMTKGFLYVARDIAQAAVTMYAMVHYGEPLLEACRGKIAIALQGESAVLVTALQKLLTFVAWNAFFFLQGLNWTGLWVMAHECGHQAFSDSRSVNDAVGLVLHSFLLVPYHSWRISHGNHHKHTNHLTKDTVFVPDKSEVLREIVNESPVVSLFWMLVTFTIGWPGYLLWNATGQKYSRPANHFSPSSPLFHQDEARDVVISDIGIFAMLSVIGSMVHHFGAVNVICYYLFPYMWVNFWLVFITYLQHTDIRVPHYSPDEWNFVRGALATVDRDFGAPLNWWLHHINDSHVVHHIFSQMPFYNAIQVTRKHIRGILGDNYLSSRRGLWTSLYESWRECRYVIPSDGVAVYRK
jgi:omega-6 fatty acid desaturase (delta-12 desaturase)